MTLSPGTATVGAGGTQGFSAAVTGTSNAGVTWSASGGTLTPSGNQATLQAPATGGSITVTATSQADPGASGSATVTVTPVQVALSTSGGSGPEGALFRGETAALTAQVTGTAETGVSWTASCGTLEASGNAATFRAPSGEAGECQVTATSTLDPQASGTATLQLLPDWVVTTASDEAGAGAGDCTPDGCTLRAALLAAAEEGTPVDAEGRSVVRIAPALAGETLVLASALPVVARDLRILGPEGDLFTVDAGATASARRRVLDVSGPVAVELRRLRLTGGEAAQGAGLRVDGGATVRFIQGEISENRGVPAAPSAGGFLLTGASTLELEEVLVRGNRNLGPAQAAGAGGSVVGGSTLRVVGGAFEGNVAPDGWGGALRVDDATVHMEGTVLRNNRADADDTGGGGAIWARTATLELRDVLFEANHSAFEAGALRTLVQSQVTLEDVVFRSNTSLTAGAFTVGSGSTATVRRTRFEGNVAETRAGALFVWTDAEVTLEDVDFVGNVAEGTGGGALYAQTRSEVVYRGGVVEGNRSLGFARGGGIAMFPTTRLTLEDVRLEGNRAEAEEGGGGGALYLWEAEATLARLEILDNFAGSGPGGGVAMWDGVEATLADLRVEGNTAVGAGGGLFSRTSGGTLTRVVVRENTSVLQSGGFQMIGTSDWDGAEMEVVGNVSDASVGGIGIFQDTRFHLRESLVAENRAATAAGGLWSAGTEGGDVVLESVEIRGNQAGSQAGGMAVTGTSEVLVRRVHVVENTAEGSIGGILAANGRARVTESAIVGNDAGVGWGGGLHLGSGATLTNSTVSGNRATVGGAIHLTDGGGTLNGVTVVGNRADGEAAGIRFFNAGGWTVVNVLLEGNVRTDATPANCSVGNGSPTSEGHNLSNDASCNALLGHAQDAHDAATGVELELASGGGATPHHPLLAESAARGAGRPDRCLAVDQRGWTRASPCDIGAWDSGATPPPSGATVAGSPRPLRTRVDAPGVSPHEGSDTPAPPGASPAASSAPSTATSATLGAVAPSLVVPPAGSPGAPARATPSGREGGPIP